MTVVDFEEKRLDKLPPREMSGRLMRLAPRERLQVILDRTDAEAVVAALAVQDFYISVQETGPDDSLPLLALATVAQLKHLFDIEWWQKDTVRPAAAIGWLERLSRASEEKLAAWLFDADFELLVALFKKWLIVAVLPEDTDLIEARDSLPQGTLDDQYFWEPRYPQYEDLMRHVLSFLFEVNYGFYKELLNHVLWSLDAEVEEDAYRFHKGRLEDRAIPDFYEAIEIYREIRVEKILPMKEVVLAHPSGESAPSFAVACIPEGDLLSGVLKEIPDAAAMDTIQLELASLSNKVVVADGIASDNPQALRRAVEKTVAYVNLGLELRSEGDPKVALGIVREVFLEHLFRLAQGRVAQIKGRLKAVQQRGWLSFWPTGIKLLDFEWLERGELLLGKTPRILRPASGAHRNSREDFFRSRRDLGEGNRIVEAIEHAGVLFESVRVNPESLAKKLWDRGQIPDLESVTLGALVWTAAAQRLLTGRWEVAPLAVTSWPSAFPVLAGDAIKETILTHLAEIAPEDEKSAQVKTYLDPLFESYEEEMSSFSAPPDPAIVRFFLFSGE